MIDDFLVYRLNGAALVVLDTMVDIEEGERVVRNCDADRVIFDLRHVQERNREHYAAQLAGYSEQSERDYAFVGLEQSTERSHPSIAAAEAYLRNR